MRVLRLTIACAVLAGAALPAAAQPAPTREQIEAMPPAQAAEALLRQLPSQIREVGPPPEWNVGVDEIAFASVARSSGNPGVCEATVYRVALRPVHGSEPARAADLQTENVFKVVGPLETEDFSEAQFSALERTCAGVGPVLTSFATQNAPRFFSLHGARYPTVGLLALQHAIRTAQAGRSGTIDCRQSGDEEHPCGEAALAALRLDTLISMEIQALALEPLDADSRELERRHRFRVEAHFLAEPGQSASQWVLRMDVGLVVSLEGPTFALERTQLIWSQSIDVSDELPPPDLNE